MWLFPKVLLLTVSAFLVESPTLRPSRWLSGATVPCRPQGLSAFGCKSLLGGFSVSELGPVFVDHKPDLVAKGGGDGGPLTIGKYLRRCDRPSKFDPSIRSIGMLAARPARWRELPFELYVRNDKLVVHKDRHVSRLPRTGQSRRSITLRSGHQALPIAACSDLCR